MRILVPLAEGFEEIEAISIIDVLRRAGLDVTTAHLKTNPVMGGHNIAVMADRPINGLKAVDFNCIVLPGGSLGSDNLKKSDTVISFIKHIHSKGGYVAAICAAPVVLSHAEVLFGKRITCFPGVESEIEGTECTGNPVEVDDRIVTGRGAGCAIPFALELVKIFSGEKAMKDLKNSLQVYWI